MPTTEPERGNFIKIDRWRPAARTIRRAADILAADGTVIYPTETFYALGAHPESEAAVEKVYAAKGRGRDKPLPLIAADPDVVRGAAGDWPEAAETLALSFWPGSLSLVIEVQPDLLVPVHGGSGRIAVRVSPNRVASALAAAAGGFLISTSANRSGEPPPRSCEELARDLLPPIDAVLDGGKLAGGSPSTIVDVTRGRVAFLREGAVPFEKVSLTL
jgi:L-threonylcarbamoyladenylate synthase